MTKTWLFDLDGTLINTNDLIIASFHHTLEQYYPGKYTARDFISFIGEPLEDSFHKVDAERVEEMIDVYRRHNMDQHDELVKEYPHVYETIETLFNQGYSLGVVTTKRRETVNMGLKLTGLDRFFDVIVTIDDVTEPKPHPEPIFQALEKLGSSVAEAAMVGDSPHDIQAGKNAGVKSVAVSWSVKGREAMKAQKPDFLIDDMSEILAIAKDTVR